MPEKGDSEVIEGALRRDSRQQLLDRLWASNDLKEVAATELAVEGQHAVRTRDEARYIEGDRGPGVA
jgi:hypothetical protein